MHNPRTQGILFILAILAIALLASRSNSHQAQMPQPTPTVVEHAPTSVQPCVSALPAPTEMLATSEFIAMWNSTTPEPLPSPMPTPSVSPAELIHVLDMAFDQHKGSFGGQCSGGWWVIPANSIVWTNTFHKSVFTTDGARADDTIFVPIRPQGGWGVFLTKKDIYLPTPGRFVILDLELIPARDLPSWQKPK